jgi:peptide deformylase
MRGMSIHSILKIGDPRLLRTAKLVTEFDTQALHTLVADLIDTMQSVDGAGLAAPQIGVDLSVVVFGSGQTNPRYPNEAPVPRTVLLNPVITSLPSLVAELTGSAAPEMAEGWEGCLSVPGLRGIVPRFARVRYQGFDAFGTVVDRTVDGFHARVVQHECDHLVGMLYPMRMTDFSRFGFTEVLFPGLDASDD